VNLERADRTSAPEDQSRLLHLARTIVNDAEAAKVDMPAFCFVRKLTRLARRRCLGGAANEEAGKGSVNLTFDTLSCLRVGQ